MPTRPPSFRPSPSRREAKREVDRRRGSAHSRGYTAAWSRQSKRFLDANPFCAYCALDGRVEGAELTDHLFPHRGDERLFWCELNWVASCKPCHDGFKQQVECRGHAALLDLCRRLGRDPSGIGV